METIIACTIFGVFILLSFWLGLYYGSKVKNNEPINTPIRTIKKHKEEKETKFELDKAQEIMNINLQNIENYDGTGLGQKDFPS